MKNIRNDITELLKTGYCTPSIVKLARKLKEPSTTIHYNVKQMEKDRTVKTYKAVLDYKKIDEGFCSYVLINLSPDEYSNPDRIAKELAKFPEIESVDIITGDWEIIAKIRASSIDAYYNFVKGALSRKGIAKVTSLNSLRQIKTEFVEI